MVVQWLNLLCWLLFIATPGYVSVVSELSNLIQPAFQSLAVYVPLVTFYPLFKKLFTWINDTRDLRDSIMDYGGIDLSGKKENTGAYSVEMPVCSDKKTGQKSKPSHFSVLPLDEDVFEIDANTRLIKVPSSFATNGISVQGDEVAEVIYFEINRSIFCENSWSLNDSRCAIHR